MLCGVLTGLGVTFGHWLNSAPSTNANATNITASTAGNKTSPIGDATVDPAKSGLPLPKILSITLAPSEDEVPLMLKLSPVLESSIQGSVRPLKR
jgi:hypothetical protein